MDLTDQQKTAMIAYESFILRASEINMPFMLKGSYVTRQYFPDHIARIPADLDWVYIDPIDEPNQAEQIFSHWVTQVTELETDDDVVFRSFKENAFWRMMDYAMADDFPTVNTDILCWVKGTPFEFDLDISFNLDIPGGATPLKYKPLSGPGFMAPYTAPLHLQVAWKIHQTLVRPRMKDLLDLTYLVQHPDFNSEMLHQSFEALLKECLRDKLGLTPIAQFLNYELAGFFQTVSLSDTWQFWRHGDTNIEQSWLFNRKEMARYITNANRIPIKLEVFVNQFRQTMATAGFTIELMLEFPDEIAQLNENDFKSDKSEVLHASSIQEDPVLTDQANEKKPLADQVPVGNRLRSWFNKLLKGSQ